MPRLMPLLLLLLPACTPTEGDSGKSGASKSSSKKKR